MRDASQAVAVKQPSWWDHRTERVQEVIGRWQNAHISRRLEDAYWWALSGYGMEFDRLAERCESPIELLFLAAILPEHLGVRQEDEGKLHGVVVEPQTPIGNYRVDFLVSYYYKGEPAAVTVVECDGHDYHDKTREQAERDKKRDREITKAGYPVFRFTGRELHRDPREAAQEVLDFLFAGYSKVVREDKAEPTVEGALS